MRALEEADVRRILDIALRFTPVSAVVAANIVVLLSGLATVGSVQDAITGYQLTAVSRGMDILLSSAVHADLIAGSFAAAAATGLVGTLLAPRLRVTPLVIIMAGIVPLVPGLTLFRGFVQLVNGQSTAGATLGMAAGLALALGAGAVLGPLLAPSVRRELARYRRHVRGRSRRHVLSASRMPQLAGIRYIGRRSA